MPVAVLIISLGNVDNVETACTIPPPGLEADETHAVEPDPHDGVGRLMSTEFWSDLATFQRDLVGADETKLKRMRTWAENHAEHSNRPGLGRSPKARRMFRQMKASAEEELGRRGLLRPVQSPGDDTTDGYVHGVAGDLGRRRA